MSVLKPYIKEMRLKSWIKNIFVFIPLVFSLGLFHVDKLLVAFIAFVAFCLASSAVYVFNDIFDADKDAAHPVKQKRPIASRVITRRKAAVFAATLAGAGIAVSLAVNLLTGMLIIGYLALNLIYTLWLKHKPIVDCFCIATGFILRVYAGGAAIGYSVSAWLFLTMVAMSLFMAFGKRSGELIKVDNFTTREVLKCYNLSFLRGMIFACAGMSVVFYALWTMYRSSIMIYTVPLIIFIVSKYLLRIHCNDSHSDPTTVIFEDKSLLAACGVYGLLTIVLLYFGENV